MTAPGAGAGGGSGSGAGAATAALLPPGRVTRQEIGFWGMLLFCATEATLFACLFSSYFYLGVSNVSWPPRGVELPHLRTPGIMTVLLVSSSVVLHFADRARADGRTRPYRIGTAVTVLLGLGFLALQATEYRDLLQHMPPSMNAYASIFYLITGLHGSHVAFGLLVLGWTLTADLRGRLAVQSPLAVRNASVYWHFVDAVWLVVFTCLYLSPRWYR